MSCRSSFSFMITASRVAGTRPVLCRTQYREDRRDRGGWIVSRDDGDHVLLRLGRLEGVELGAEQLPGEEVTVPGGEPPGEHVAVGGQEDPPGLRAAAEQVTTADSCPVMRSSIQAPMARSQGQRSSSVSGTPARIFSTFAAG